MEQPCQAGQCARCPWWGAAKLAYDEMATAGRYTLDAAVTKWKQTHAEATRMCPKNRPGLRSPISSTR
jgi:hypothetical protein